MDPAAVAVVTGQAARRVHVPRQLRHGLALRGVGHPRGSEWQALLVLVLESPGRTRGAAVKLPEPVG